MKKNKNLVFVIPDLEIGGAQRVLIFLINSLIKNGFKIKIIVFKKPQERIFNLSNKVKIKNLYLYKKTENLFYKIFYNIYRITRIRSEIKKSGSARFISFLTTTNILTLIASLGLKKKIIINERNDPSKKRLSIFWRILRTIIYRNAEKIFVNQPNLNKKFIYGNQYFIPNPITVSSKKKIKRTKIILSVARLDYQKNLELLINSFSKSAAMKNNWKLLIFGKGKEKKKLIALTKKLNIAKFVFFKGIVKNIDFWYKKSEIFVLPSRFEGMPNALIEAMYYKLAVIGTEEPGIKFFVKNKINGLLFKISEEKKLTQHINLLIKDKKMRRNLANNAYKYVNNLAKPEVFLNKWMGHLK